MNKKDLGLLDANILIYASNRNSEFYQTARELRDKAIQGTIMACITPQVLWEFFAVITDKKRVEKPLLPQKGRKEVECYWGCQRLLKIFPSSDSILTILTLIRKYHITGQHIHDVCLIATMLDNNIRIIYSGDDTLRKFKEITVINPFIG